MDTIVAIHTRRSIRSYEDRPVERDVIADILWDAAKAPTTQISEAQLFTVIEGKKRIAAFGDSAIEYARANRTPGPGYDWLDRPEFSVFHGAPAVVVISAPGGNSQSLGDCTRSGQNLALSAHARGLATCWVGAPLLWLRTAAVKDALKIPSGYEPFAVFALGYPSGPAAGKPRDRPQIVWADAEDEDHLTEDE